MPINKLGAPGVPLQAPFLPIALISGTVFNLPAGQGTLGTFGAAAAPQIASNNVLSGQYIVNLGANTNLEIFDPGQGFWRNIQSNSGGQVVSSDGTNFRLSNTLSCPTGGTITNAGAGYANHEFGDSSLILRHAR